MFTEEQKKQLQKADYKLFGKNCAVKLCHWCKASIKTGEKKFCYKEKFYGIKSHRCLQIAPCLGNCNLRCLHCWRNHEYFNKEKSEFDDPIFIVDESIKCQKELLSGLGGVEHSEKHLKEANIPNQVAISLDGEPCLYPYLSELIEEYNKRKFTTFLVTNGTLPEKLKSLKVLPTNLYVSLTSSNKKMFKEIQNPISENLWEKILETLELFPKLKTTKVIRMTMIKDVNDKNLEEFAELLKIAKVNFIEIKSFMSVGSARKRYGPEHMLTHNEIKEVSEKLCKLIPYKIKDEQKESRVVLLEKITPDSVIS